MADSGKVTQRNLDELLGLRQDVEYLTSRADTLYYRLSNLETKIDVLEARMDSRLNDLLVSVTQVEQTLERILGIVVQVRTRVSG